MDDATRYILLASNKCTDMNTANTRTDFINQLARPILNRTFKKLHLRLETIVLSPNVTVRDSRYKDRPPYIKVQVRELEGQRAGTSYSQAIGGFPLPETNAKTFTRAFLNNPSLAVRYHNLYSFGITLTDELDRPLDIEEGMPTMVWLKVTEEEMDDEFLITCISNNLELHPFNTLNNFISPLPSPLLLPDYEVALQNVVFPPHIREAEDPADLYINGTRIRMLLSNMSSTRAFSLLLREKVKRSPYGNRIAIYSKPHGPHAGKLIITRPMPRGEEAQERAKTEIITIECNATMTKACGQVDRPFGRVNIGVGESIVFTGRPNIYLAMINPVALLDCSIIKPNIVGDQEAQILQFVPIMLGRQVNDRRIHEPVRLVYHPVQHTPIDSIKFRFVNSNLRERHFESDTSTDPMIVTLTFRRKKTHE